MSSQSSPDTFTISEDTANKIRAIIEEELMRNPEALAVWLEEAKKIEARDA